jgi:DNA-directed RNA polymerase subunit RPC12/RpoP
MATIVSVNCNQCGAPLEVEETTRFVTCAHCGASLEIKQTGTSRFTAVLDRLERRTEHMAGSLETIRLQNELERLDREWEMSRRQYASPDKHGQLHYPDSPGQAIGAIIGIFIGIAWTFGAVALLSDAPDRGGFPVFKIIFPLFGVGFVVMMIVTLVTGRSKATAYHSAQATYHRQRQLLLQQLSSETSQSGKT